MKSADFDIIDAQIHQPAPVVPFGDDVPEQVKLAVNVELAREAMDSAGVDATLVVAALPYIDACVTRYPERFIGVETFMAKGAELAAAVERARDDKRVIAGRLLVTDFRTTELSESFTSGAMDAGFEAAEKVGLPLFLSTHGQAAAMRPLIERHPELIVIIDHVGVSQHPVSPPRDDPWDRLDGLLSLAEFANVSVKLCGLPLLSDQAYPFADVWPNLDRVLAAFGPERLMWASDYTRLRMAVAGGPMRNRGCLYSESRDMLLYSDRIDRDAKAAIFGGTVKRLLGWQPSAG
ncbi:amidohydrolase family protein [Sphingomonas gei]|uniref:amidohydrolase family protein n=1 Tax=Sphingomonas gei TaxID=1395960 RepID=UPI001441DA55|nr:amidohydrolase family protein [Sphingomonas gei]